MITILKLIKLAFKAKDVATAIKILSKAWKIMWRIAKWLATKKI